jgi:hypothetical protein
VPAGCLELDLVWRFPSAADALQAQAGVEGQEDLPPRPHARAATWRLLALGSEYERDNGHRGFVLRPGKPVVDRVNEDGSPAWLLGRLSKLVFLPPSAAVAVLAFTCVQSRSRGVS